MSHVTNGIQRILVCLILRLCVKELQTAAALVKNPSQRPVQNHLRQFALNHRLCMCKVSELGADSNNNKAMSHWVTLTRTHTHNEQ